MYIEKDMEQLVHNELKIVNLLRDIADSYVVNFYIKDYFHTLLPKSWQNNLSLNNMESKDMIWLLNNNVEECISPSNVFPLSLLALRRCSREFSLSRIFSGNFSSEFFKTLKNDSSDNLKEFELTKLDKLPNEFCRQVSKKKRHEICRISEFIANFSRWFSKQFEHNFTIVDVGCGLGHLSRLLTGYFHLPVISVESNANLLEKFNEFDIKLHKRISQTSGPPRSICLTVGNGGLFEDIRGQSDSSYFLLGLHACGNLSVALLKQFAENANFRAVLTLSCCYMKNQTCQSTENSYYPLSNRLQHETSFNYSSLELACHANEHLVENLIREGNLNFLKIHSYRALLESILNSKFPTLTCENNRLKNVKNAHLLNFFDYCKSALNNRVDFQNLFHNNEFFRNEQLENDLKNWKKILPFIAARLLLAPLIESILLIDRVLFLKEHGFRRIHLFPLFDPNISARNLALFCMK